MKQIQKILFYLTIVTFAISCEAEADTERCTNGVAAKLFYTPTCSTINGYIILEDGGKTFVFQHEIDEKFQRTEIDVCVEYQLEESRPLTAECAQAEIITITSLRER